MRMEGLARGTLAFVLAALALSACSPMPYPTVAPKAVLRDLERQVEDRAELGEAEVYKGPRAIALCYSRMVNTPEEVLGEARYQCREGDVAYYGTDTFWTSCSLQQHARATFICTPEQSAEEASPGAR